jgi:hypothetical protein
MRAKKIVLAIGALSVLCMPAQARPLEVTGRARYLSEWEIKAAMQGQSGEFSGPITWKHTGFAG